MAPSRLNYLADFDSAAAMLRALANFLQHRAFPDLGLTSALRPVAVGANLLPVPLRQEVYKIGGYFEAVAPETLVRVKDEDIDRWVVEQYPARRYPAVLVGSSNGALTHLAAALGAPWLPQTFLIPARQRGIQVDEPKHALELGGEPGRRLLDANPDLQLHHMHDANQDRLMTHYMTYFRIKRRRLGEAYARFLAERLQPGGIIILVECRHSWPTTRVGPRHVFQHGGAEGSARKSTSRVFPAWRAGSPSAPALGVPSPDGESPEAAWGFEQALRAGRGALRGRTWTSGRAHRVRRARDPSPLVTDLYRWRYRARGLPGNRLLVDSFILMDPWWRLRLGAVPFWMKFNTEVSAAALEAYLDEVEPYDEIHLMLFAHGVNSIGLTPIERWRALLGRAKQRGCFVGVDEKATRPILRCSPAITRRCAKSLAVISCRRRCLGLSSRTSYAGVAPTGARASAYAMGQVPDPAVPQNPAQRCGTRLPRGRYWVARAERMRELRRIVQMPRVPFAMLGGAVGLALLAGCANLEDQVQDVLGTGDNEPRTLAFECNDDRDFTARLSGDREQARVDVGDETYELDLTDRDDGDRVYSNDDGVELTVGDDQAYLRIPGGSDFQDCERT